MVDAECFWRRCLVDEKNPDIAWQVKTLSNSPEFGTPEGAKKHEIFQMELNRLIQSDPEYAALEKEKQKLQEEYQKALDDFAAKSDTREAVEYRKVKALLDELDKTASDSGK